VLCRIDGEGFTKEPALNKVCVAGYTQRLSAATGVLEDSYIVSVLVERGEWTKIDFANLSAVDPGAALARFDRRCSIDSSGRMREIESPF